MRTGGAHVSLREQRRHPPQQSFDVAPRSDIGSPVDRHLRAVVHRMKLAGRKGGQSQDSRAQYPAVRDEQGTLIDDNFLFLHFVAGVTKCESQSGIFNGYA